MSVPPPPARMSSPAFPARVSSPPPPLSWSSPALPTSWSSPSSPKMKSLPLPPVSTSAAKPPLMFAPTVKAETSIVSSPEKPSTDKPNRLSIPVGAKFKPDKPVATNESLKSPNSNLNPAIKELTLLIDTVSLAVCTKFEFPVALPCSEIASPLPTWIWIVLADGELTVTASD